MMIGDEKWGFLVLGDGQHMSTYSPSECSSSCKRFYKTIVMGFVVQLVGVISIVYSLVTSTAPPSTVFNAIFQVADFGGPLI